MRSLGPQSLHNGKVLSYLDKAVMATRLVPIHKLQGHWGSGPKCFPDIAINTITIPLVCPMLMHTFDALSLADSQHDLSTTQKT